MPLYDHLRRAHPTHYKRRIYRIPLVDEKK